MSALQRAAATTNYALKRHVLLQMVFVIQRGDCAYFAPCHAKDPTYGKLVIEAAAMGVRVIALRCGLEGDAANGRGIVRYIGPAQVMLQHGL